MRTFRLLLLFAFLPFVSACEPEPSPVAPDGESLRDGAPPRFGHVPTQWQVTDLGTLGGNGGTATDVNDNGVVVGWVEGSTFGSKAFRWSPSDGMVSLGDLAHAHGINDNGVIVGHARDNQNQVQPVRWTNGTASSMEFLTPLNPGESQALDVNDAGYIVGYSDAISGFHATIWDPTSVTPQSLGTLGGFTSKAHAINDQNEVVGFSWTANDAERRPFYWTAGDGMEDLGDLGSDFAKAWDVSDGTVTRVVGTSATAHGDVHAFLWSPGDQQLTDLGEFQGSRTFGDGVNSQGVVVGTTTPSGDFGYVWSGHDSFSLLPALPNGFGNNALAINDSNWVVGTANVSFGGFGETHPTLWRPASTNQSPVADAGSDLTVECGDDVQLDGNGSFDSDGSIVLYEWFDANDALVATGPTPILSLPLGTHTLTLRVTDDAGATDEDEVVAMVVDTTAPAITLDLLISSIWPPTGDMVTVATGVTATDACDPSPTIAISVSIDDGDAPGPPGSGSDWDIVDNGDGTFDVRVRSERNPQEDGRTYTITVTATDSAGNTATETATVKVAHDQGKKKGK